MADKTKPEDEQMLKWLDVLLEFDPEKDGDALELLSETGSLEMHDASESGALEEDKD